MKEVRTYKLRDAKYGKVKAVIVDKERVAIQIGNLATFVDRKWFFENYVEIKASIDRRKG